MKIRSILVVLLVMGSFFLSSQLDARVVRVTTSVKAPAVFKGPCPHRFEFVAKITVNAPCVVKYQWKRSDNATAPVEKIAFKKPGTRMVTSYWQIGRNYSGWKAVAILGPNRMMSNKAKFKLVCVKKVAHIGGIVATRPIKPGATRIDPNMRVRGQLTLAGCPDPAAHEIRFQIVKSYTQFKKRIRITGIVKNIGKKAFVSGPNQAAAQLYEIPLGAASGRMVAQRAFRNLAPGATISVPYERDWNSSSPSEGEFPPNYKLIITYDPDIYMDANKQNDDCGRNNNTKQRSGTDINAMIR